MTESTTPAVVQTTAIAKVSIKETVLAQFKEAEATITALADKYHNVAYAVATTKGMKEAVAARADLRDNGRLFVTKAETRIKGEVNDLKRLMADEVVRLVAIVKPVEEFVDAQIKAEEDRKAKEKAERDRIEAERVATHRAGIDKLKGYVGRAEGHPVEVIDGAAASLDALTFGPEWEEFAAEAEAARDAATAGLRKLAASERQRIENERLKKELDDARAALAAQQEATAKLAREQAAEAERIRAEEVARLAREAEAEAEAAAQRERERDAQAERDAKAEQEQAEAAQTPSASVAAEVFPGASEVAQTLASVPSVVAFKRSAAPWPSPGSPSTSPAFPPVVLAAPRQQAFYDAPYTPPANVGRPTDADIIAALALTYRRHESVIVTWLLDMDLEAASANLLAEFPS